MKKRAKRKNKDKYKVLRSLFLILLGIFIGFLIWVVDRQEAKVLLNNSTSQRLRSGVKEKFLNSSKKKDFKKKESLKPEGIITKIDASKDLSVPKAPAQKKDVALHPKMEDINLPSLETPKRKVEKRLKKPKLPYPRIAIIIDDLGRNGPGTTEILKIDANLTLAIIPNLSHSTEIAEKGMNYGHQIIVHLPMQPENSRIRQEKDTITINMGESEIEKIMEKAEKSVPYALGFNNHMGSLATQDALTMQRVLKVAKKKRWFFVDSLTTPKSQGAKIAQKLNVEYAVRSVFLDGRKEKNYIKRQLDILVKKAKEEGGAIGIAHVHPVTAQVLKEEIPKLKKEGIRFVYASELTE